MAHIQLADEGVPVMSSTSWGIVAPVIRAELLAAFAAGQRAQPAPQGVAAALALAVTRIANAFEGAPKEYPLLVALDATRNQILEVVAAALADRQAGDRALVERIDAAKEGVAAWPVALSHVYELLCDLRARLASGSAKEG